MRSNHPQLVAEFMAAVEKVDGEIACVLQRWNGMENKTSPGVLDAFGGMLTKIREHLNGLLLSGTFKRYVDMLKSEVEARNAKLDAAWRSVVDAHDRALYQRLLDEFNGLQPVMNGENLMTDDALLFMWLKVVKSIKKLAPLQIRLLSDLGISDSQTRATNWRDLMARTPGGEE